MTGDWHTVLFFKKKYNSFLNSFVVPGEYKCVLYEAINAVFVDL